jgi:hypothetical protein
MSKYYEHIAGWFDFQDIYTEAVAKAQENDILVEVGSFLGKSTSYKTNLPKKCFLAFI